MASDVKQGTVKIWFGLLKMAIQQGLPINEEFYRSWGTREELTSLSFNKWWTLRGKELFEGAVPKVSLVKATPDAVLVRIPTCLNSDQVKKQVSSLMARARGTKRIKQKAPLGFTGDVKYMRLKQYERYLGVEFDPKNAGKTIEEKTELLRQEYRKIKARLDKQRKTMREAGKGRVAQKFQYRDPDAFDSESEIRKGIDAKKVSRWRLSGKLLLLNVAEGQFPGKGYYGARLSERLTGRLQSLGIENIRTVARHKGGGVTRAQKTLVQQRHAKVKRTAANAAKAATPDSGA
jgi:hypothetical protein